MDQVKGRAVTAVDATDAERDRHPLFFVVPILVSVAALALIVFALVAANRGPAPQTTTFVVPAGTAQRILHGENVTVIPNQLSFNVGDTMVVRNEDDQPQTVGLFTVRPGETVSKTFEAPGVFKGACTAHSSGEVTITVT